MPYEELEGEQARYIVNSKPAFDAYRSARSDLRDGVAGSMSWKTVDLCSYLEPDW